WTRTSAGDWKPGTCWNWKILAIWNKCIAADHPSRSQPLLKSLAVSLVGLLVLGLPEGLPGRLFLPQALLASGPHERHPAPVARLGRAGITGQGAAPVAFLHPQVSGQDGQGLPIGAPLRGAGQPGVHLLAPGLGRHSRVGGPAQE